MTAKVRCMVMIVAAVGILSALSLAIVTPADAGSGGNSRGNLRRLAASNTAGDGPIVLDTSIHDGGVEIYHNTVKTPVKYNVLYVTITGSGWGYNFLDGLYDGLDGGGGGGENVIALRCQVDGEDCLPGSSSFLSLFGDSAHGWVPVTADLTDEFFGPSNANYQFCIEINEPGPHDVTIDAASTYDCSEGCGEDSFALLEQVSVYVDTNKIRNTDARCGTYPTPNSEALF